MLDILFSKKVLGPVIIIISFMTLYFIINRIIKKMAKTKFKNTEAKRQKTLMSLLNNLIKYFLFLIAILMILDIYGINTSALITSLGVVGLVAGLALQDTLKDFLSGITIILENQYGIGDTVTINGFKGEVISLGVKTTKLKAFNGEIKFISNRNITEVINHSLENSLAIVNVPVSYQDDVIKVEKVLNELCERLTNEITELKGKVNLLGVENLSEYGVIFKITAETKILKNYDVQRILFKEIKQEFEKNKITIPYKQMVSYNE